MARAAGRLTGLRIDDRAGQPVLRRAPTAWVVLQAVDPALLVAMQPGPHYILTAGMNRRDLRHAIPAARQQHHVRAQRDPAHGLPAYCGQFLALSLGQVYVDHPGSLRLSPAARTVPHFESCA